jgi:hypothetical protein
VVLFWTAAGALAVIAAIATVTRLSDDGRTSDDIRTTWEGEWEVPVIEGDNQSETFVIGTNKQFRLRVVQDVYEFHTGDTLTVRWEPGKVFINDVTVFPEPFERTVLSEEKVLKRYGDIPTVQDYIASHQGDASDDEVATQAMEAWFAREQDVTRVAFDRYMELVQTGSPRDAAEAAADVIRSSGLADSVVVNAKTPLESEAQDLYVFWRGRPQEVWVPLRPWRSELPPPTVTAARIYVSLVGVLDRLTYGENELTIRFEGGSLMIEGDLIAKPEGDRP